MVDQPEQIDFIVADLANFTRLEVIRLVLNVDAELRAGPPDGTPRDTGWAAANWVPSIGEPSNLASDVRDPTAAQVMARAAAQQQGLNDVLSWKLGDGVIFITNNVPYIEALNAGHSTQSPPGFVQVAIGKAIRETESAAGNKAAFNQRAAAARAAKRRPKR